MFFTKLKLALAVSRHYGQVESSYKSLLTFPLRETVAAGRESSGCDCARAED